MNTDNDSINDDILNYSSDSIISDTSISNKSVFSNNNKKNKIQYKCFILDYIKHYFFKKQLKNNIKIINNDIYEVEFSSFIIKKTGYISSIKSFF